MYIAPPLTGFPLELGIGTGSENTGMMVLPDRPKSFKIGLAAACDRQTASQPSFDSKDRAYA